MNSVIILLLCTAALILGYIFYACKIEALFGIDPQRQTPAHTRQDGVDYIPARNWLVLFGHHFSSIAGAGPIVGPAIAVCIWGWVPALMWIVFGSILLGGVHDYGALMCSVREGGVTIGDVAAISISRKAKLVLSIFTLLALILVIAVFAFLGADTFVQQPKIVVPSFGIIPLAIVVGLALYRFQWNAAAVTVAALAAVGGMIFAGNWLPVELNANSTATWMVVLLVYCYIASVIPVNILLQPRDYLSSFLLAAGILLAFVGILVSHPDMNAPAFIANKGSLGYLWPMMFITIACGANSGFHCLVASGTTSKQLSHESHAKLIGYGGMLMEGFLAAIVVILIVGGFSLAEFNGHIAAQTSPINMYGLGFGNVTAPLLGPWGMFIALTILNAFILTTLDTATRIARYVAQELFGIKNRYIATLIVAVSAGWLALGKDSANTPLWKLIWPAFGASNQLVAALAFLVISCWLLSKDRPIRYSFIPAIFMLATSVTALCFQIVTYWQNKQILLIVISLVLLVSAFYLGVEVIRMFRRKKKSQNKLFESSGLRSG
ncbi:MAG: carbon starvation protein A [Candidatus Omnitrophica bacterium]|nr:carbon starvation protein A [Candidatus Omnitrophota bacterium]